MLDEKEIINLYLNENLSLRKIGKKFKVRAKTISSLLKNNGIQVQRVKSRFNEHVFDEIDTPEKAYWLGFLYSDGNVTKHTNKRKENGLRLELKASDLNHMEKFNNFMEHENYNIKTSYRNSKIYSVHWSGGSKILWDAQNNLGCIPKKSLILKFPDLNIFTEKNLVYDFIRGYLDGDGCVTYLYRSSKKTSVKPNISIIGTKDFLEGVQKCIGNLGNLKPRKSVYELRIFAIPEVFKFFDLVYTNPSIYLDRKYNRVKFFTSGKSSISEWEKLLEEERKLENEILSSFPKSNL